MREVQESLAQIMSRMFCELIIRDTLMAQDGMSFTAANTLAGQLYRQAGQHDHDPIYLGM